MASQQEKTENLRIQLPKKPLSFACPHCNKWIDETWPTEKDVVGNEIQLGGICDGCKRSYEMRLTITRLVSLEGE